MNTGKLDFISDYLFDRNGLVHAGTRRSLGSGLKNKLMEVYHQQSPAHCNKSPHDTLINERNIEIIDVFPALAQDSVFYDKLNSHAQNFCRNIKSEIADSKEIQVALEELEKQKSSKVRHLKESLREIKGVGSFLESILEKNDKKDPLNPITDNEKKIFRFLLVSILKIDPNTDNSKIVYIIKVLTKYFHPDKSKKDSDLYSCILSKGFRIAKVIENCISQDSPVNSLILSIANLKKFQYLDRVNAEEKIRKEMLAFKPGDLKDSDKEKLLMSIIKFNERDLLDIMINRLGINNLKLNNETPLIYALQNGGDEDVIKKLIEKGDINALGLEGKTPLQIAICGYKEWKEEHPRASVRNPYEKTIECLLDCHKLCVDAKDSRKGFTALCYIVLQPKIDSTSLQFINQLINLGANIDHSYVSGVTVRSLLKKKLNEEQFSDIEILADNLEDIRNGVKFHGDEIVELIDEFNKAHYSVYTALEKVREAIINKKTLRQKKSCRKTVLMAVIEADAVSFIKLLLKRHDFTLDQLTTEGDTPLDYARKKGADNIIKYLSDAVST